MGQCDDAVWDSEIDVDLMDQKSEYREVAWIGFVCDSCYWKQDPNEGGKAFPLE